MDRRRFLVMGAGVGCSTIAGCAEFTSTDGTATDGNSGDDLETQSATFSIKEVTHPNEIAHDKTTTVTAVIENQGEAAGSTTATLYLGEYSWDLRPSLSLQGRVRRSTSSLMQPSSTVETFRYNSR